MADFLEDDSVDDRDVDRRDFRHSQMNVFKHEFRTAITDAEEDNEQMGFDDGVEWSYGLARRLGSAKDFLTTLSETKRNQLSCSELQRVQDMSKRIEAAVNDIAAFAAVITNDCEVPTYEDFPNNILPVFDQVQMELFGLYTTNAYCMPSGAKKPIAAFAFGVEYGFQIKKIEQEVTQCFQEFSDYVGAAFCTESDPLDVPGMN